MWGVEVEAELFLQHTWSLNVQTCVFLQDRAACRLPPPVELSPARALFLFVLASLPAPPHAPPVAGEQWSAFLTQACLAASAQHLWRRMSCRVCARWGMRHRHRPGHVACEACGVSWPTTPRFAISCVAATEQRKTANMICVFLACLVRQTQGGAGNIDLGLLRCAAERPSSSFIDAPLGHKSPSRSGGKNPS